MGEGKSSSKTGRSSRANPTLVSVAVLAALRRPLTYSVPDSMDVRIGQRVLVLGSMLELGKRSEALHRQVLADALARDVDVVLATGAFAEVAEGRREGIPPFLQKIRRLLVG